MDGTKEAEQTNLLNKGSGLEPSWETISVTMYYLAPTKLARIQPIYRSQISWNSNMAPVQIPTIQMVIRLSIGKHSTVWKSLLTKETGFIVPD